MTHRIHICGATKIQAGPIDAEGRDVGVLILPPGFERPLNLSGDKAAMRRIWYALGDALDQADKLALLRIGGDVERCRQIGETK